MEWRERVLFQQMKKGGEEKERNHTEAEKIFLDSLQRLIPVIPRAV
jgi:hypothetical protein